MSLELGTVSNLKALRALRTEDLLHHHGGHGGDEHRGAAKIKTKLVRAFYPDGDDWKAAVWEQGQEVVERAAATLGTVPGAPAPGTS